MVWNHPDENLDKELSRFGCLVSVSVADYINHCGKTQPAFGKLHSQSLALNTTGNGEELVEHGMQTLCALILIVNVI